MKKIFIAAALVVMSYCQTHAQDEPYYGGFGDGNSFSELSLYTMTAPPVFYAYFGGTGDGNTGNELTPYIMADPPMLYAYHGGNGDGQANSEQSLYTMVNPPMFYAYLGGNGDGQSHTELTPYTMADPAMFYAYFGGEGDGYSGDLNAPFNHANPPMFYAYFGGDGDGFAGDLLPLYIPAALPVNLLSFEGRIIGEQSLLEWKVAMEKDISHYNLQRCGDGKSYHTIFTQKATALPGAEKRYDHIDAAPLEGANYYRLQIADNNSKTTYSSVVLLYFKHGQESIAIYPNPATQQLHVQYATDEGSRLRVTDMRGVTLLEQDIKRGNHTATLSIGHLASGMYLLQIGVGKGFSKSIRFVKQ